VPTLSASPITTVLAVFVPYRPYLNVFVLPGSSKSRFLVRVKNASPNCMYVLRPLLYTRYVQTLYQTWRLGVGLLPVPGTCTYLVAYSTLCILRVYHTIIINVFTRPLYCHHVEHSRSLRDVGPRDVHKPIIRIDDSLFASFNKPRIA
jgi:hypothetical protein